MSTVDEPLARKAVLGPTSLSISVDPNSLVVEAKGLSVAFGGNRVLCNVDCSLTKGTVTLLQGENGAGKTTLLNVLSGFIRPDSGRICLHLPTFKATPWAVSPETLARRGLGRLWQDIRLFPTMTILDNVLASTPNLLGVNPFLAVPGWLFVRRQEKEAIERALHHLDIVGLADRANSTGDRLSVGQMKRVAIARLLQAEASLLLLDEPLAGLDSASVEKLVEILGRLSKKNGKTLLIVEHRHDEIKAICTGTWHLADGSLSISQGGSVSE